jgi:Rieske 2Fe-2S family protein
MGFEATLPGRYFHDPAIYAREQERIFSAMWVCVGRADAVAAPGAYVQVDVGRENVLVVRGRDGEVRAFLNVCRHRGARLCPEPCGQLAGAIQCRYHAWSYGLDGRLIGAPNLMRDERLDRDAYGLIPVALAVWEGLIWVNLADEPEPVTAQLEPPIVERLGSLERFARYGLGDLAVGRSIAYEVRANWKLVVENFMECYHCAPVHPELVRLLPAFRQGTSYQGLPGEGTSFAEDVAAFTLSGQGERPRLPGLLPEDDRLYLAWVLWPNVFVNLLPDHVIVHTLLPLAPDRSRVVCDWLFDPAEAAKPDFDPSDTVEIFDITNKQDWEVCELTQLGMTSRAYERGGLYVANEEHITVFRDLVLERLGD